MKVTLIKFICLGCFFWSCSKTESLQLQKLPYFGNEIKIDGYYHNFKPTKHQYDIFFLFRNGVYRGTGGIFGEDQIINTFDSMLVTSYLNCKIAPYCWGVFQVKNDSIFINYWTWSTSLTYPQKIATGKIVNDTTLYIMNLTQVRGNTSASDTFKFRKFQFRPDSISKFIN
jgi:hypothetical protein